MKIVAYLRVSTQKQARSGLGRDAQRAAIESYARDHRGTVAAWYTETESGKNNERAQLAKALHHAKVTSATLVIAKLDRLSRNAAFLLTLRDSGARFVAADIPDANHLTIGILALVAEQERKAVSQRTKDALAAKKKALEKENEGKPLGERKRLGNPKGAAALRKAGRGNKAAIAAIKARADAHAQDLRPVVDDLAKEGMTSLGAVAAALNERGMLTPRGGRWHKSSVRSLLDRLAA
jgi:DNA invertase Pin-like site-specific DNA recombinase